MPHGQYDLRLVADYCKTVKAPSILRRLADQAFAGAVGDTTGLACADYCCCTGASTRQLCELGRPLSVIGLDVSEAALAEAREAERLRPLGIEYEQLNLGGDPSRARCLNITLATMKWGLHYPSTLTELVRFAAWPYQALLPRGRFVGVVQDRFEEHADSARYGESFEWIDPPHTPGGRVRVTLYHPDGSVQCSFEIRYWSRDTYTECLEAAGFRDVTWLPMEFHPESRRHIPNWRRAEEIASSSIVTARKP